jgi:hypothetical protein
MKTRLKYNGGLIYGATDFGEEKRWHISDAPTAGGEFTACGVAHEQIEDASGYDFAEMPSRDGGICTCPECIEQLYGWQEMIERAPGLFTKEKNAKNR